MFFSFYMMCFTYIFVFTATNFTNKIAKNYTYFPLKNRRNEPAHACPQRCLRPLAVHPVRLSAPTPSDRVRGAFLGMGVTRTPGLFSLSPQVELLHFFSRPGRFSQKLQARFEGGIIHKTADRDAPTQFFPAIDFLQVRDHIRQFDAVQGVIGLRIGMGICVVHEHGAKKGCSTKMQLILTYPPFFRSKTRLPAPGDMKMKMKRGRPPRARSFPYI